MTVSLTSNISTMIAAMKKKRQELAKRIRAAMRNANAEMVAKIRQRLDSNPDSRDGLASRSGYLASTIRARVDIRRGLVAVFTGHNPGDAVRYGFMWEMRSRKGGRWANYGFLKKTVDENKDRYLDQIKTAIDGVMR